jgi:cytochrome b561
MTPTKYPLIMRLFHWIMSLIIIGLIIIGFVMTQIFPDESFTGDLYKWHKSFGVVVLILIGLRIAVRLANSKSIPPMMTNLPRYEQIAATVAHKLLYALMVIAPVSGYLMSSAYPKSSGIFLFGLKLPDALPKNEGLAEIFTEIHEVSVYCLAALIAIHIAGVIKHRFFDSKDHDVLNRML